MGHRIAEAIIENGQIKYVNKELPPGRMRVHLIYDVPEKTPAEPGARKIVIETSGIYQDIDAEAESEKLRRSWERNAGK